MVTTPTRQENILYLFLTNTPSLVQNTETLPSLGTSDHDIVFHELHIKIGRPFQPKRPIRIYRRSNWEDFKTDLSEFGKTCINSDQTDQNSAWNMFKIELNRLSSLHIPTKMCKSRRDLPWLTPQIIRLIRKRDKMYTKLKHLNTSTTTKQFKDLKYNIQKQIRNAYWLYIESVIFTGDSQPCRNKKFYSFVKHNKTEQCGVAPLKQQGPTYSDTVDKANILNRQFESVFSKPQPVSIKKLAKQATASIYTPKMQIIDISIEGVDKLLQGLSPNKASGPDEISPKILKELHHEIAPILTLIFNLSLETGVVPIDWRTADAVPVYKKGSKSKASNYRPISLTCIASKLLEHILVSNIMSHFDDNQTLH